MFLHRLKQLFSRIFMRLLGREHRSSPNPRSAPSQAAISVGRRQTVAANIPTSGLASGHWLDDTRRMRPQIPPWALSDSPRESRHLSQPNTFPIAASCPPDRAAGPVAPTYEPTHDPALLPAQTEPETTQPAGMRNVLPHEVRHRQLTALKYLIRLGVYNEGFSGGNVPEQYQHSMGMYEAGDEFWLPDSEDDHLDDASES